MRTTLELDDDVLVEARELAKKRGISMGRVISDLARKGLGERETGAMRNGVPVFPRTGSGWKPTVGFINELRDEL